MRHKTLSLYVPHLEGGYEDAGRIELGGYTLISDERLYDLEAAEAEALEEARLNGMGAERELALMAKLEAAEKERDALRAENAALVDDMNLLRGNNTALRAKIAEMEKQEPVMWVNSSNINSSRINKERGGRGDQHTCSEKQTAYHDTQLYALPGAQGEEK